MSEQTDQKTQSSETQAHKLLREAERKLSPKTFLQNLFGFYRNHTDDAIECYQRAGNLFKISKNWLQAGTAFQTAARLNNQQNNRSEAANNFVTASKCLEKWDPVGAINALLSAIQIYTDLGRFVMAAKLHSNIADIYERNLELDKAVQHYEEAADYFKVEENHACGKKCQLKVAEYSAEFGNYEKAISIFEEIAFYALKNPLLQYSAKENFLKALLCHMCVDILNSKHGLDVYIEKYPGFQTTREYKFFKKIVERVEEVDEDGFIQVVKDYDDISQLNSWQTKILLRIKEQINTKPDIL